MEKIIYVVKRYELGNTGITEYPQALQIFDEKAFTSEQDAQDYKNSLDPTDNGFEYTCPCGCGDVHWRSWEVELLVLSLPDLPE